MTNANNDQSSPKDVSEDLAEGSVTWSEDQKPDPSLLKTDKAVGEDLATSIVPKELASTEKTLGNTCESGCKKNVPDVEMFGEDLFKLLSKASSQSEGWMKSTKAMSVPNGAVLQVTTQQRNPDGSYSIAESATFIPGVAVTERGSGYYLK